MVNGENCDIKMQDVAQSEVRPLGRRVGRGDYYPPPPIPPSPHVNSTSATIRDFTLYYSKTKRAIQSILFILREVKENEMRQRIAASQHPLACL